MIPTYIQIALAAFVIALLLWFYKTKKEYLSIRPYTYLNKNNVPVSIFWLTKKSAANINQMTNEPSLQRLSLIDVIRTKYL